MADPPPLRQTDYLPSRFDGNSRDHDLAVAHFLTFRDYLEAHGLQNPANAAAVNNIISIFKRSLQGQARIWIEGKAFADVEALRTAFIGRFSPSNSQVAKVKEFENITFTQGDSAEIHLQKVRKAADRAGYGDIQIRDKFLSSLPEKCRAAVVMSVPEDAGIQDLVSRAQTYLDLQLDDVGLKEVTFAAASTDSDMDALKEQLNKLQLEVQRGRQKNRSPESRRPRSGKLICDYCLVPGHKWRECRKRKGDLERRRDRDYDRSRDRRRSSRENSASRGRHMSNSGDRNGYYRQYSNERRGRNSSGSRGNSSRRSDF